MAQRWSRGSMYETNMSNNKSKHEELAKSKQANQQNKTCNLHTLVTQKLYRIHR
jgi:hypothetical protein